MTYSAHTLSQLLAARHSGEVYIPECKMGAVGSRTLDGWALLATWSPMTAIGYEIKVSRSDWLKDQKLEEYRAACHLFFVVAPKGIVAKPELPAGVGLLEPIGAGTGQRLVMRVKAVRQEPEMSKLARLMAYALMWKRVGGDPEEPERARRARRWATWVAERGQYKAIAHDVRGRMRTMLRDALDGCARAERRAEELEEAARVLNEMGIRPGRWRVRDAIQQALRDQDEALADVERAMAALGRVQARLEQAQKREKGGDAA